MGAITDPLKQLELYEKNRKRTIQKNNLKNSGNKKNCLNYGNTVDIRRKNASMKEDLKSKFKSSN